jgi:hypothetical protein
MKPIIKVKTVKAIKDNGFEKSPGGKGISDGNFVKGEYYIELYHESYGLSVHIYGGEFMNGFWPTVISICDGNDINLLNEKLIKI